MNDSTSVRAEDVLPVGSRVSWGAVFAGAVIALALYFLLTLIGSAIGLSVTGRVEPSNVGVGAAVWAVVSLIVALFVGGWVTSQFTVGENKAEAALHGIIVWGVLFGMLLWLLASGVSAGFNAMVGMAHASGVTAPGTTTDDWEAAARRAGVSQETIDEWRAKAADAPADARRTVEDPQNRQEGVDAASRVTWWTVLGTVLSMAAAVMGSLLGSGPSYRLILIGGPHPRTTVGRREPALHS